MKKEKQARPKLAWAVVNINNPRYKTDDIYDHKDVTVFKNERLERVIITKYKK